MTTFRLIPITSYVTCYLKEKKLFLLRRPRLHLKISLFIYMIKDQIFIKLVVKSEIKSQIIWYKPSPRSGCADPLLCMHIRRRRKVGWTSIQLLSQSNQTRDKMCWCDTSHQQVGCSRWIYTQGKRGGNKRRGQGGRRDLSLFLRLPLSFSLLSIRFACHASIGRNSLYL